jgi:hypothetical protein
VVPGVEIDQLDESILVQLLECLDCLRALARSDRDLAVLVDRVAAELSGEDTPEVRGIVLRNAEQVNVVRVVDPRREGAALFAPRL